MNWIEAMRKFEEGKLGIICTNYADAINLFEKIRTMTDKRPDWTLRDYPDWGWGNRSYIAYYCNEKHSEEYHGRSGSDLSKLQNSFKNECRDGSIEYSEIQDITINEDEFLDILFQGMD